VLVKTKIKQQTRRGRESTTLNRTLTTKHTKPYCNDSYVGLRRFKKLIFSIGKK